MIPRTQKQKAVFELSKTVTPISSKIEKWALKDCSEHIAFATKSKFWCTYCGTEHLMDISKRKTIKCAECKHKVLVQVSKKRNYHQQYYVGFAEVIDNYQVIRLFRVNTHHKMGKKASATILECIMQFIPQDLRDIVYVARACNMGGYEPSCGSLEIRKPTQYRLHLYNPYPYKFHPLSKFKDEYSKYGINHELQGLTFLTAARVVKNDSKAETILKAKQFSLFGMCSEREYKVNKYWSSIKIAIRHQFKVEDGSVWIDHLDMLERAGKDIRNPKYICSPTIMEDHQRLIEKRRVEQAKREADQIKINKELYQLKKLEDIENFKKMKSPFFGLVFKKDDLEVKVLESIQEFKEEGDALHHCVFTNSYYKNASSIVFSARISGKRIETVEVSLSKMQVVQSRGLQNLPTPYHDEIVRFVNSNINKIQDRLRMSQQVKDQQITA